VIYGAGGAVGRAVATAFAGEGARLFLSGRTLPTVEEVASKIAATGGTADAAEVDALDQDAVEAHLSRIISDAGRVDISFNLISFGDSQGQMLVDVVPDSFFLPLRTAVRSQIITAGAAARRMVEQQSGVILFLTATPARLPIPATGDFAVACAALEGLARQFAAELGPHGVRAVCIRSAGSPEAPGVAKVLDVDAAAAGLSREVFQRQLEEGMALRRFPSLAEVGKVAAMMASEFASPITGTVANMTCGAIAD
jgi:NAD(P)-dependent dehydrogenase (short-subunit alcohol dehydrogenase family)